MVLYFVWPEGGTPDTALEWVAVVVGLAVFIGVFVWEVGEITSAELPATRAVEALAVVATLFVVMVSTLYLIIDGQVEGSFSEPLTRMGALYFTVTVFATVGFGDISPVTDGARAAVTAQMVLNAVFIGLLVKVIFGAAEGQPCAGTPQLWRATTVRGRVTRPVSPGLRSARAQTWFCVRLLGPGRPPRSALRIASVKAA